MRSVRLTPRRALLATVGYVILWQAIAWGTWLAGLSTVSAYTSSVGWGVLYLIGLMGTIVGIERASQRIEANRAHESGRTLADAYSVIHRSVAPGGRRIWNPLDPAAWFYGQRAQRLRQSLAALAAYSMLFGLVYFLVHFRFGLGNEVDPYELPTGGGQEMIKQTVRVQKVIKKKYIINPYSSILFNPPPIDQLQLNLVEESQNLYQVGQGGGEGGAGFGQGTATGKIRFIRLRHPDRGWDRNFGIGGDRNMLAEYASRTRQKVSDQTEYIDIAQLSKFPLKKSPPLVYLGGTQTVSLSSADKKALTQYLTERHGTILGDNLGGQGFHSNFIATMNEVTGTTPVPIPRDDRIHQLPYRLPELPIVVAHGGTTPLGWKLDGRWVVYYHPGALSDAWRDDHAGIKREVYEMCYQLGVNIIFYAHREYNTWLQSQQP